MNNGYSCCDDKEVGPGKKYNSIEEAENARNGTYKNPIPNQGMLEKSPYANLPQKKESPSFTLK